MILITKIQLDIIGNFSDVCVSVYLERREVEASFFSEEKEEYTVYVQYEPMSEVRFIVKHEDNSEKEVVFTMDHIYKSLMYKKIILE